MQAAIIFLAWMVLHDDRGGRKPYAMHVAPRTKCRPEEGPVHPTINPGTGWVKVPPPVPLSPAVPFCTRVSAEMKPPLGRDPSVSVQYKPLHTQYHILVSARMVSAPIAPAPGHTPRGLLGAMFSSSCDVTR